MNVKNILRHFVAEGLNPEPSMKMAMFVSNMTVKCRCKSFCENNRFISIFLFTVICVYSAGHDSITNRHNILCYVYGIINKNLVTEEKHFVML